ncbi:MAG: CD0415/CD1112 family protein [Lachnospiraceae bacterium]|nr:CD0415/CD1112 family protein [Lachnospiraceae bacterium]
MNGIIDKITEFIRDLLSSWITANLTNMFTDVNDKVGTIADEVARTPSTWNAGVFSMVRNLSEDVILPIAGMIISFVLVYELITMVIDKNNMHEFDTSLFFRFVFKACLAVMILSRAFDITMAVFDVGSHLVTSAAGVISGDTDINVGTALTDLFNSQIDAMEIGELLQLALETMVITFCMDIMSLLITVILYGRMIECYLWISVSPIPYATAGNREWSGIAQNYFKGLCALAIQGFFIMVCVAVYSVLVASITVADNLHIALWMIAAYTVLLCFSLFRTSSLARSVLSAH